MRVGSLRETTAPSLLYTTSLKCLYTNAQGLRNKLEELCDHCLEDMPDIVAVTETWFRQDICDAELAIPNFCLLRNDRSSRGGGVALYYHNSLSCVQICDEELFLQDTLWCTLKLEQDTTCVIAVIYRPPSACESFNQALLEKIRLGCTRHQTATLLLGDFNLPQLYSQNHVEQSIESQFQQMLEEIPLFNHVYEFTRIRADERPSILDLVLSDEVNAIEQIRYASPLGRSDHLVLKFDYVCRAQRLSDTQKTYRKINFPGLIEALRCFDQINTNIPTVNAQWTSFSQQLMVHVEANSKHMPRIQKESGFSLRSRTKKWMSRRNEAWYIYSHSRTAEYWSIFCGLRNKVTLLIREDKRQYQLLLLRKMERNPKLLYRMANARSNVKPGIAPLMTIAGLTTDAKQTADVFADFFQQVYAPVETNHNDLLLPTPTNESISEVCFKPESILLKLQSLKSNVSPGIDAITSLILKNCASHLYRPLTDMFTNSMICSRLPTEWKCSIVSPIYKAGSRSSAANYRPVSLLPTVSKVMEREIAEVIIAHMNRHNLFSDAQHGFRKTRSCVSNLLIALDDWTQALDAGHGVHVCYLDISKAFDRVNHNILIQKLKSYGILGNLLEWLRDYLRERHAMIRVDGAYSKKILVTSGVPQGSVLGPILFLIYINDLPAAIKNRLLLFADDAKLWTQIHSEENCVSLQKDLDALYKWSVVNKLPFNLSKCKVMQIGKSVNFKYRLGSQELEWVAQEKDLGVLISSNLKAGNQCLAVYKKTSSVLGMFQRLLGRFTHDIVPIIMNTYIRPRMEYGVQAWAPWMEKDIHLLQRIYHRVTKSVIGLQSLPYNDRLSRLNLFDFNYRRLRGDLILMFKAMKTADHPLKSLFTLQNQRSSRSHDMQVSIPHSRVNCRRYFFAVRVCFSWNYLPAYVAQSSTVDSFKRNLDKFMSARPTLESR